MKRKHRVFAGAALILGLTVYLVWSTLLSPTAMYLEVESLKHVKNGSRVAVNGSVENGSVRWDPDTQSLTFTLSDENAEVPVVYEGVMPNNLQGGRTVVVHGTYEDGGIRARKILVKCPSKYEPARGDVA